MIKFLKAPTNSNMDFYEQMRFLLTWRISLLFALVVGIITVISGFTKDVFFPYYLIVEMLVLLSLYYMRATKQFRAVSKVLFSGATLIIAFAVFNVRNVTHTIEILWMIIVALSSFFILGKIWGYLFLGLNAVIFTVYFNTVFANNLANIDPFTPLQWSIMSIEFIFAMLLIGVIMNLFFRLNEYEEQRRSEAYSQLSLEKEKVEQQNNEVTVLLQEIHHRVKNNLQVIISLLRIQSQDLKSDEAKKSFNEAISRIMTMSLIHQKMYEHEKLTKINFENYLETLIGELLQATVTEGKVELNLSVIHKEVGTKTIVPLALIINELIVNSIKHAFNDDKGIIDLKFSKMDNGKFVLEYNDSGTWKDREGGFGLQLIDIFTDQLEGNYSLEKGEGGSRYVFEFTNIDNA